MPGTLGTLSAGALVFDDSFLHHAWNNGEEPRVILLFDFFHPELEDSERGLLIREIEEGRPGLRYLKRD